MNLTDLRAAPCAGAFALLALFATACGSGEDPPDGAKTLSFDLTDEGCLPHKVSAPAGPIAFEIENAGTSKVTEMEIMDGEEVLGEEENITDGLDGSFSVTLEAGKYTIYCPGGSDERGTLTVTGKGRLGVDRRVLSPIGGSPYRESPPDRRHPPEMRLWWRSDDEHRGKS